MPLNGCRRAWTAFHRAALARIAAVSRPTRVILKLVFLVWVLLILVLSWMSYDLKVAYGTYLAEASSTLATKAHKKIYAYYKVFGKLIVNSDEPIRSW